MSTKHKRHPVCPRCLSTNTRQVANYGLPMRGRGQCFACKRTWDTVHPDYADYVPLCPERRDGGTHEYTADLEYDITGQTVNCEYCGEEPPKKKA